MEKTEETVAVSNYISKFLRDNFGKGPEYVHCSIGGTLMTIYIRNFISPTEKVLLNQKHEKVVEETRDLVMSTYIPELKANILRLSGMEVKEFYYDWGLHNKSAMFVCICSDETKSDLPIMEDYYGKEKMDKEVIHLSRIAQRTPDELLSYKLNDRTYLFIRNGILVNIEKQLIRDGLHEQLRMSKRKLEKGLLHNNSHFEEYLDMRVIDIFADWDFDLDKSVTLFITNPTR